MAAAVRKATKAATTKALYSPTSYIAPVALKLGPSHPSRLRNHFETSLQDDLMYMHYQHHDEAYVPPQPPSKRQYDIEADPYAKGRPPPRPKGNKSLRPLATNVRGEDGRHLDRSITRLEKIQLHIMAKEALVNKQSLLAAIFQLRALSGSTKGEGGHKAAKGIEIIRARKNLPQWKLRRGVPVGVKVDLKGDKMYEFLGTLVEFVFPRLREWNGVQMPAPSANRDSASMVSGVVSIGFGHEAVELFPQVKFCSSLHNFVVG